MKTAEEIRQEIAKLSAEVDLAEEREVVEREARDAAEKRTEIARRKGAELAIRQKIEAHERQLARDVEADRLWWEECRANCYRPAQGELGRLGFCQPFVNALRDSELQGSVWCWQCVHGRVNPHFSIALRLK